MYKYGTVYFCGYAKLPSALASIAANGMLTLGLLIEIETGTIVDVSVTLLSALGINQVRSYFLGKNINKDFDQIVEEVGYCHQGNAAKSIIKAAGDIRRNYLEYMEKIAPDQWI